MSEHDPEKSAAMIPDFVANQLAAVSFALGQSFDRCMPLICSKFQCWPLVLDRESMKSFTSASANPTDKGIIRSAHVVYAISSRHGSHTSIMRLSLNKLFEIAKKPVETLNMHLNHIIFTAIDWVK
jgi:hypothetical protein